MKVRYLFLTSEGRIVFSNLNAHESTCIEEINTRSMLISGVKSTLRGGRIENSFGTVFAVSSDSDYIRSSKKFTTTLEALANTLGTFIEITQEQRNKQNNNTSRLLHNLRTINAHNIQEIFSVVPQDVLSEGAARHQVTIIEEVVKQRSKETAVAFLRIIKNNTAMKTEFSVFDKLFDGNHNPHLEKKSHNVHKVLMNILYQFFPDFTDNDVWVKVECPKNTTINAFFDYESVQVAFYHLIENAVKYIKPHTEFIIKITPLEKTVTLFFEMMSLQINESERNSVFIEGFSGELAKKLGKSGSGIGMTIAKHILEINGARLSLEIDPSTSQVHFGLPYQKNTFKVELRTQK